MQKPLKKNIKKYSKFKKFNKFSKNQKKRPLELKIFGRPFFNNSRTRLNEYSFLTFHVYPNNVFCTLKNLRNSKFYLLNTASSGKYKIDISKKTLKHKLKFVITSFLKEIRAKKLKLTNHIGIKLIAPIRLKKVIIKLLSSRLKGKNFMFEVVGKKVFNGCRAKKKIRKKRRGLRMFK